MDKQNKRERLSHRKRRAEHKKSLAVQRSATISRRGFRLGDLVLIVVILALIAFFSYVIKEIAPVIQSIFDHRYEDLTFTVSVPIQALSEEDYPVEGDSMRLLDASEGGNCIVVAAALSEDGQMLFVTLTKENAHYREGVGYEIDNVRIAVGASLDLFFDGKQAVSARIVSLGET